MSASTLDEGLVTLAPWFGSVHMQTRFRREGNRFIGEGRSLHYDLHGKLERDTGWCPTGVEMIADDPSLAEQVAMWLRP